MRKLLSIILLFLLVPPVLAPVIGPSETEDEVLTGYLGPSVVVQQPNLTFTSASVGEAYPGETFEPSVYLTNVGDGDAVISSSELVWTDSSKEYVSISSPETIPPGFTSEFSFLVSEPECPDFGSNNSFKFNITYYNATNDLKSYVSGLYWYNVSNPLSLESVSVDTNQVFSVYMVGLDRATFVINNDGEEAIDYTLSESHPSSVFPEFVTYKGVYHSNTLSDQSFTLSGHEKHLVGIVFYPVSVSSANPFEINVTTGCGNVSRTLSFDLEVVTQQAGFFSTVPGTNHVFLILLVFLASAFLLKK